MLFENHKQMLLKKQFLRYLTLFLFTFIYLSINATTLFENFDNPSATVKSFTGGGANITYSTGGWYMYMNVMTDVDRYNGTGGVRIRGYANSPYTTMMFDKTGGAGVVSFNYGSYSSNSGGEFILQKSTNQGSSWVDVGTKVSVPIWNGTFHTYSVVVNESQNVRFRIAMTVTSNANTMVNIDDFQITDYNIEQTAIPVFSSPTGIYEMPQTVSITSTTPGAIIYYTTDGTVASTSSNVYSTPLSISTTTKIRAIAVATGKVDSREEIVIVNFPVEVSTIAGFYNFLPVTGTNPQYYKYTGEAVISFVYWASSTSTAKKIVLQDNSGGIIIDDYYKFLSGTYSIGDKVTGFTAQVNNTNDAPLLYPTADFTVLSNNNTIDSKVITLAKVPANTYQLVQLNDLFFDAADGLIKFGVNSFRIIHDTSTPVTASIVYNTPGLIAVSPNYIGTVIPTKTNLICLVMKNNTINSGINNNNPYYYLFPRMLTDINVPYKDPTGLSIPSVLKLSVSDGKVHFETPSVEKVRVHSVTGECIVSSFSVIGQNSIALPKGIYFVSIGASGSKVLVK